MADSHWANRKNFLFCPEAFGAASLAYERHWDEFWQLLPWFSLG